MSEFRTHKLKVWPKFYEAVESGAKTAELREDDRDYRVGDFLVLREWNPVSQEYTGKSIKKTISYIIHFDDRQGLRSDYVVLCLAAVPHEQMIQTCLGGDHG